MFLQHIKINRVFICSKLYIHSTVFTPHKLLHEDHYKAQNLHRAASRQHPQGCIYSNMGEAVAQNPRLPCATFRESHNPPPSATAPDLPIDPPTFANSGFSPKNNRNPKNDPRRAPTHQPDSKHLKP
jgi:hypothetical protein